MFQSRATDNGPFCCHLYSSHVFVYHRQSLAARLWQKQALGRAERGERGGMTVVENARRRNGSERDGASGAAQRTTWRQDCGSDIAAISRTARQTSAVAVSVTATAAAARRTNAAARARRTRAATVSATDECGGDGVTAMSGATRGESAAGQRDGRARRQQECGGTAAVRVRCECGGATVAGVSWLDLC